MGSTPGGPREKPRARRLLAPVRHWREEIASLPNMLTIIRLALVPVLWVFALQGRIVWLGVGLVVAALTDVLDGAIARHWHLATRLGSRLDSIADHTLTFSVGLWLVLLRPEFVRAHLLVLGLWFAIGMAALLVGWIRFRRVGDLHLYSAKLAGTLGYVFAIWVLIFGTYSTPVFYLVIGTCFAASAESLVVVSTRSDVDEHIGSILLPSRKRGPAAP